MQYTNLGSFGWPASLNKACRIQALSLELAAADLKRSRVFGQSYFRGIQCPPPDAGGAGDGFRVGIGCGGTPSILTASHNQMVSIERTRHLITLVKIGHSL